MCVTGSESPVVVVLSGSMEPGFKRVSELRIYLLSKVCRKLIFPGSLFSFYLFTE